MFIRVKTTTGALLLVNSADIVTVMEVQPPAPLDPMFVSPPDEEHGFEGALLRRAVTPAPRTLERTVHLEMRQRADLEVVSPSFEEFEEILLPINPP